MVPRQRPGRTAFLPRHAEGVCRRSRRSGKRRVGDLWITAHPPSAILEIGDAGIGLSNSKMVNLEADGCRPARSRRSAPGRPRRSRPGPPRRAGSPARAARPAAGAARPAAAARPRRGSRSSRPASPASAAGGATSATWGKTACTVAASARANRRAGQSMTLSAYAPPGRSTRRTSAMNSPGGQVPRHHEVAERVADDEVVDPPVGSRGQRGPRVAGHHPSAGPVRRPRAGRGPARPDRASSSSTSRSRTGRVGRDVPGQGEAAPAEVQRPHAGPAATGRSTAPIHWAYANSRWRGSARST